MNGKKTNAFIYLKRPSGSKKLFTISKCQLAGMLEIFVFAKTAWLKVESIGTMFFFP